MSIQSEIERLQSTKAAIKTAIIGKGQSVADTDTFASYADKIAAIDTATTPVITVDANGKITATSGSKSNTKQLTTKAATTITPGTSNQTAVAASVYTTGAITVKGDADLVAANIVSGKEIFGVTGTAGITATDDGAGNVTITMVGVSGVSVG